jgi:hypothetical protein
MLIDASHIPVLTKADTALESRIRAEFSEMPGLKLTLPQACRLFNVERIQCERVLDALTCDGELANIMGTFARPGAAPYGQFPD